MSRARALALGATWLLAVVCAAASLVLYLSADGGGSPVPGGIDLLIPFAFLSFVTVGALLAAKRPRNPIGWLFLAAGMLIVVDSVAAAYAYDGKDATTGRPAGTVAAAWVSQWVRGPAIPLLGVFLVLLFPTGRLLTPRWRFVAWLGVVAILVDVPLRMLDPGELQNLQGVENPVGIGRPGGALARVAAQQPGSWLILLASVASVVSLVLRFRRAEPVERQQLKWFLAAASVLCAGFLSVGFSNGAAVVGWAVWLAGVVALPVATAIAVLRYRLYEIDRLISRALAYAALTLVLGVVYVGLVLGGQALFSSFAGGSNLAIAASTLVVAALFLPVRARVQGLVDRRFYRRRYDAQHTLEAFGSRLREQVELERLQAGLAGVVDETMQPGHLSVWLRERPTTP